MSGATAAILALTVVLAAANGANDVSKGVATLTGAGVTGYRTSIAWGTLATLMGAVASVALAGRLTDLFSRGIVELQPSPDFTVAVLCGVIAWVIVATAARLPVSTTHAIVGALLGAGLVASPDAVVWGSVAGRVALPLVVSLAAAFALSAAANTLGRRTPECICVSPTSAVGFLGAVPLHVTTGTSVDCAVHGRGHDAVRGLHWASSGVASFARGLNDTPKIVAIAAVALTAAGWSTTSLALLVAGSMAAGSIVGGRRVERSLAEDIVRMDHGEGVRANLAMSLLVGIGANRGLPMSTTHVATGAIAGTSGTRIDRLHRSTLANFAVAWLVTPPVAAATAAATFVGLK